VPKTLEFVLGTPVSVADPATSACAPLWAPRLLAGSFLSVNRLSALLVGFCTSFSALSAVAACADFEPSVTEAPSPAADAAAEEEPSVSTVEIVRGVPDRGRDPAVVSVDVNGEGFCTGTLIAKDVVLTARHCVARTSETIACPPDTVQVHEGYVPARLGIRLGDVYDRGAPFDAVGREVIAPSGTTICDADIAAIVLDRPLANVRPIAVRPLGPRVGERIRAVGFGARGDGAGAGVKMVREHVPILRATPGEFLVGEATCQGDSGGPALDESTGDLVGVVSRGGPSCEGANVHNIYTRADAWMWLVQRALSRSGLPPEGADGGAKGAGTPDSPRPVTDTGAVCTQASDCAAGVCALSGESGYCTRTCGTGDRCPNGFHCKKRVGFSVPICTKV